MMKFVLSSILFIGIVNADICGKPQLSGEKFYTTTERRLSGDTAFVVKFSLNCDSGSQGIPLHAEVGGKQYPVTKSPEGNVYQLSWVANQEASPQGTYTIRFFDEEGVNALRKAIRNGEDTSSLKSLFDYELVHPGNTRDLWVTSEAVGLIFAGLIYYAVCKLRSEVIN